MSLQQEQKMEGMPQEEELSLINDSQRPPEFHQPQYPCDPYPWLIYCDGVRGERQTFHSILDDKYQTRFLPELENQHIMHSNQEWLVLLDYSTRICSVLNILTMEKLQLPPCKELVKWQGSALRFVFTLSKMDDGSWSLFILTRFKHKLISCHLGVDINELVEPEWFTQEYNPILDLVCVTCATSFGGNLYIMTDNDHDLLCADLSADPEHLHLQQVIKGYPLRQMVVNGDVEKCYLVESCGELLLVIIAMFLEEVIGITIFKADFNTCEWVRLDGLGDRAIFLDDKGNGFSYSASVLGLNANCIYYARNWGESLLVYDVQDQSISIPFPCPIVAPRGNLDIEASVAWIFISNKSSGRSAISSVDLHLHHGKTGNDDAEEARRGLIEYEAQVVESNNTPWVDIPNDILCELYSRLIAGERAMFRSTCRSWYCSSLSLGSATTQQQSSQLIPPNNNSDQCSSPPCMMLFSKNRIFHPIYDKSYDNNNNNKDFQYLPGFRLVMAKDGWFLGYRYGKTIFWNPLTKEKVILPDFPDSDTASMYFSSAPTSADWFVIAAVSNYDPIGLGIYTIKCGDDSWSRCIWLDEKQNSSNYPSCNPVVYNGFYYFLGTNGELLIQDSKSQKFSIHEIPETISHYYNLCTIREHYILETDGRILAVFVEGEGSSITIMEWNISEEIWETVESLGKKMLFVSNTFSCCVSATTLGTGNKIYFPRFVGSHGLFYSLSTKKLHTFEIPGDSTYQSFIGSKLPLHTTWWML